MKDVERIVINEHAGFEVGNLAYHRTCPSITWVIVLIEELKKNENSVFGITCTRVDRNGEMHREMFMPIELEIDNTHAKKII